MSLRALEVEAKAALAAGRPSDAERAAREAGPGRALPRVGPCAGDGGARRARRHRRGDAGVRPPAHAAARRARDDARPGDRGAARPTAGRRPAGAGRRSRSPSPDRSTAPRRGRSSPAPTRCRACAGRGRRRAAVRRGPRCSRESLASARRAWPRDWRARFTTRVGGCCSAVATRRHSCHTSRSWSRCGSCPQAVLHEHAAFLARVMPELASQQQLGPAGSEDHATRYLLFDAVARTLDAAARQQPLLLVLEDLHWAEPPTLLLLRHVMRAAEGVPLLILATYRTTEAGASEQVVSLRGFAGARAATRADPAAGPRRRRGRGPDPRAGGPALLAGARIGDATRHGRQSALRQPAVASSRGVRRPGRARWRAHADGAREVRGAGERTGAGGRAAGGAQRTRRCRRSALRR